MMSTSAAEPTRKPRPVLLALVIGMTVLVVVGGALAAPDLGATGPASVENLLIMAPLGAVYIAVSIVILLRAGWNRIGWALLLVGAQFPVVSSVGLNLPPEHAEFLESVWSVGVMLALIAYVALVFPSGRLPGGRSPWARIGRLAAMALAVFVVATSVDAIAVIGFGVAGDQTDFSWLPRVVGDALWLVCLYAPLAGAVLSMVARFRGSHGDERAQLSWVMAALVLFLVTLVLTYLAILALGATEDVYGWTVVPILAFPVSIAVAITRYRLYEIDRIISRTVSYALVVGALAAVFAAIAIGVPQLLGLRTDNQLLVAAGTLAVAALFNPLRKRVQVRVDRRFNRTRFDAHQEMDRFAERLRTELDLDDIEAEILDLAATTMQPAAAGVWLREEQR